MQSQEENLDKTCEKKLLSESHSVQLNSENKFFGPALPPHLLKKNLEEPVCRPVFSDHLSERAKEESTGAALTNSEQEGEIMIGPKIPEFLKGNLSLLEAEEKNEMATFQEEDDFGPSTDLMSGGEVTAFQFTHTQNINKQTSDKSKQSSVQRETWMTELPEKKSANFGLLARHFKSRIQTDKESDDSVWTDTPEDKKKKEGGHKKIKDHKEILQMKRLKERDKEMEKLVKKAAKKLKKKQSLLEMHVESLKKKKKVERKKQEKEGKVLPERRPFDRNVDLQIRKIDENKKKAILNKSQFLNDRFAPGQSKFL